MPQFPATYPAKLEVRYSFFMDNKIIGSGSGGAIANGGNQVNGKIVDAMGSDLQNSAVSSTAALTNNLFIGNISENVGGAFINWHGAESNITKTRFSYNSATNNGGAIASIGSDENNATIFVNKAIVTKNNALTGEGGGLFARFSAGEIANNKFSSNTPNDITDESGILIIK